MTRATASTPCANTTCNHKAVLDGDGFCIHCRRELRETQTWREPDPVRSTELPPGTSRPDWRRNNGRPDNRTLEREAAAAGGKCWKCYNPARFNSAAGCCFYCGAPPEPPRRPSMSEAVLAEADTGVEARMNRQYRIAARDRKYKRQRKLRQESGG